MNDKTEHTGKPLPRFSPQVEAALRQARWHPGRVVSDDQLDKWLVIEWFTEPGYNYQTRMFSAAWNILREFGGLTIGEHGPGLTCMRQVFIFDPIGASEQTQSYNWPLSEWMADGALFPIGYFGWDEVLAVDGRGRIVDADYNLFFGDSIEAALENIIIGIMPRKMELESWKFHEASHVFPMMRKRLGLK